MYENNTEKIKKLKKKGFFFTLINKLFQTTPKNKQELLDCILNSKKNKLINKTTYKMLSGVINITQKKIGEIIVPRSQMITIKSKYSLHKCLSIIIESAHSRFPVMSDDNNYVKGFLMAKDLLPFMKTSPKSFCIKNILRPAIVVPESKYLNIMLKEFQVNRYHMAIVIDEFGDISGLVTIEDILELIVGEIDDEYDNEVNINIQKINQNTFIIKALTEIKEFNKFFKTKFKNQDIDTIGGLVMQEFQYLPKIGEKIKIKGYKFQISIANSRRIIQLKLTIPKYTSM
ncbi:Magnesium and cobalt efflux protein CorC [Buchnera aphidicola (Phyllaphis fagi)]|uniref:CNNM family magnesium/cobalt transport protein CorC n=1 Tax=Buchnera aphidicola TaxID=9 RepID=UPI0034639ABF